MRVYVIVNPYSRHGYNLTLAKKLAKKLKEYKIRFKFKFLKRSEKISGETLKTWDYDYLVVVGGDGTINSTVKAMIKSRVNFPIITLLGGTGGELPRYTNILKPEHVIKALSIQKIVEIDVFKAIIHKENKVEEHVVVANMQIGHFAQSIMETPLTAKKTLGGNGYMFGVIKAAIERKDKEAKITVNKNTVHMGKTFTVHLGNLKTTRGGIKVTPLAKPNDGKIDVLIARHLTPIQSLKALPKVLTATHLTHPAVIYMQTREIKITTIGDHTAIDGEYIGKINGAKITHTNKIKVLTRTNE